MNVFVLALNQLGVLDKLFPLPSLISPVVIVFEDVYNLSTKCIPE